MSRSIDKMEKVANKIESEYQRKTRMLQFDFSLLSNGEGVYKLNNILGTITEDVSILVNNVGMIHLNPLHKHPPEVIH
jgi:short-subunit dehydrogenase